jgi:hypothetical protein
MTGGIGQSGGFDMFQQQQQQMGYNVNQSVISSGQQGYPSQQPSGMISGGGVIPVTALTNLGVAAEAVGQISELKQYLSRQVPQLFVLTLRQMFHFSIIVTLILVFCLLFLLVWTRPHGDTAGQWRVPPLVPGAGYPLIGWGHPGETKQSR